MMRLFKAFRPHPFVFWWLFNGCSVWSGTRTHRYELALNKLNERQQSAFAKHTHKHKYILKNPPPCLSLLFCYSTITGCRTLIIPRLTNKLLEWRNRRAEWGRGQLGLCSNPIQFFFLIKRGRSQHSWKFVIIRSICYSAYSLIVLVVPSAWFVLLLLAS